LRIDWNRVKCVEMVVGCVVKEIEKSRCSISQFACGKNFWWDIIDGNPNRIDAINTRHNTGINITSPDWYSA
jgi:hypothetical protein